LAPQPLTTVLMPVYNGELFVRDAIASILHQTYREFELLIIDDGSTDGTPNILSDHQQRDSRIVVHRQDNQGLIATLNRGLSIARGTFIARMDADDIALPRRLAKQVAFLSKRPDVGILGTAYWLIEESGRHIDLKRFPASDLHIRWANLLAPAFGHPTVMVRRDLLVNHKLRYDPAFPDVEDYELWRQVLRHSRGANLGDALLERRDHPGSISNRHREAQLLSNDRLARQAIAEELPGFPVSLELVSGMRRLFVGRGPHEDREEEDRVALGNTYLDMLGGWISNHRGEPGIATIARRESARVAAVSVFHRAQGERVRLFRRLLKGNPLLPLDLAAGYTRALGKRFSLRVTKPMSRLLRSSGSSGR
jgi:glycosyltransferase involved in cell wall biosynthesis